MQFLIGVCFIQNYFEFNDKIYIQREGLSSGSPLSPLLVEIFMDHLEANMFNSQNQLIKRIILYWCRYVDNVFYV